MTQERWRYKRAERPGWYRGEMGHENRWDDKHLERECECEGG